MRIHDEAERACQGDDDVPSLDDIRKGKGGISVEADILRNHPRWAHLIPETSGDAA